ncbi:MAG TPA: RNA polymerase factor sigma-54 [Candidatus Kapabacteria bacterium]|nr:RNA polymerase factor sigma-54 [Candidatus Kapabacteria bacterium]HPO63180.1 RNA polymerase factor sigma-54 [Candidatus Kapabacteria bacterium]
MKLSLDLRTSLSQTLTPQQIQYLKLLQLPVVQLEQQVLQEIEQNPMLEEIYSDEQHTETNEDNAPTELHEEYASAGEEYTSGEEYASGSESVGYESDADHNHISDTKDPFEFYKLIWQDNEEAGSKGQNKQHTEDDTEEYQIKDNISFIDELFQQFRMLPLKEEEIILGEYIIGNVDSDGYLRRELEEIVEETNQFIIETNNELKNRLKQEHTENNNKETFLNPARKFAIPNSILEIFDFNKDYEDNTVLSKIKDGTLFQPHIINEVNLEMAEKVLEQIQTLDPPGIGSRSVQECLIAQCKVIPDPSESQELALRILQDGYDAFAMKHFHILMKQFEITEEELRQAIDIIRKLNPRPGSGDFNLALNTVIPDFIVERDEEKNEIFITLNDSRIPPLRLNQAYEKLKADANFRKFNKDTREWIRTKYEDAKFLIQAIRQRKNTMLKVMTAIAGLQRDFFEKGKSALKPLIYKDVADNTGLDISTVCRIVNGKYVQTEFGIFELKYFFSESLPNDEGEDVSTTVVKQVIKEIVDNEPKNKPYSDEIIAVELKKLGYQVARRTIAKYRELLKIPIARLRKEI